MESKGLTNERKQQVGLTNSSGFVNSSIRRQINPKKKEAKSPGLISFMHKDYQKALKQYKKELKLEPNSPDLHYEIGLTLYFLGKHKQALKEYEKTVELDPGFERAWHNMGIIFYENSELIPNQKELSDMDIEDLELSTNKNLSIEKAIEMIDKAIKANPRYELAYFRKGYFLGELKRFDQAIQPYQKSLEINPKNKDSWYNLGVLYYDSSNFIHALECFEHAIELNIHCLDNALLNKACILCDLKKYDQCKSTLIELLEKFPDCESGKVLKKRMIEGNIW